MNNNSQRIEEIRLALQQAGLDALICRLPENVLLASGYYSLTGFSFVLLPVSDDPILIVYEPELPYAQKGWIKDIRTFGWALRGDVDAYQSVEKILADAAQKLKLSTIGYEAGFESVAPPHMSGEPLIPGTLTLNMYHRAIPSARWIDASTVLYRLRARKTPHELDKLRIANQVAAFGLQAFYRGLVPGKTEAELASEVEAAIYAQGVGYKGVATAKAWAEVMSGPHNSAIAYRMFLISSDRPLETGDLVLLELGTVVDGYWSDLTRTGVVGTPTAKQEEIWQVVRSAQQAAIDSLIVGHKAKQADLAAFQAIQASDFHDHYPHFTGHGIGFRYHEPYPMLRSDNTDEILEPGMVTSVEPGIYIDGVGGIRIEDDVAVLEEGTEILSTFPRELQPQI